jgi:hypothetical protein
LSYSCDIIKSYGFWDVPCLFVVAAPDRAGHWMLDCPFDRDEDEYAQMYEVYELLVSVESLPENWSRIEDLRRTIGRLPVAAVDFDETRRAKAVLSLDRLEVSPSH